MVETDMVKYDYELREKKGSREDAKYVLDMKFLMEKGENKENLEKYKESVMELLDLKDEEKSASS